MSIVTLDGVIAGARLPIFYEKILSGTLVAGTWYSTWLFPGMPGAGVTPSVTTPTGSFFTCAASQVQGQLTYTNTGGSDTNYLMRFSGMSTQTGSLIIADRIWADSLSPIGQSTSTAVYNAASGAGSSNAVWSGSFPRSIGLGGGDSSGKGIVLGLEVFTTLGAGASTPKVTYVDSAGAADTATCTMAVPATATAGSFFTFSQNANHSGFRSVSYFHSNVSHTSGLWGLVAFRPLAVIQCAAANVTDWVDAVTSGFPITFQNTVPMLIWVAGTTTAPNLFGQFVQCHG
jgi:hypothetical protein